MLQGQQPVKLHTKSSSGLEDSVLDGDFITAQVEKRRAAMKAQREEQLQQGLQGNQQQQQQDGQGGNLFGMC